MKREDMVYRMRYARWRLRRIFWRPSHVAFLRVATGPWPPAAMRELRRLYPTPPRQERK